MCVCVCGENNNKKNVQNPSASSGGAFPGGGEDSLAKIMEQFKDLDQNPEFQNVMENMMQQLMSKDVLYEPMQEIRSKYPEWLRENEDKLPPEELLKYQKQFDYVSQICQCYEREPSNFPKIIELMQAMQECGQPPEAIVSQLSSSLNAISSSSSGGTTGAAGLDENCSIM